MWLGGVRNVRSAGWRLGNKEMPFKGLWKKGIQRSFSFVGFTKKKTFYEILEVPANAPEKSIKKAFMKKGREDSLKPRSTTPTLQVTSSTRRFSRRS